MAANQLVQGGIGSTDWAGRVAPAGGVHTGQSTITMQDGTQFVVASNAAEVRRKLDPHAVAQTTPTWIAFDQPNVGTPVVLNASLILGVA